MTHTFNDLTVGQEKAALQKLGGTSGVLAFLSDEAVLTPAPKKDAKEKQRDRFAKSYEAAMTFRCFLRGWDEYQHDKGMTFNVIVSRLTDQMINYSSAMLSGKIAQCDWITGENKARATDQLLDEIEEINLRLREFKVKAFDLPILGLSDIKLGLREDNYLLILQGACTLRSFIFGMETMNDILLAPVDKIN